LTNSVKIHQNARTRALPAAERDRQILALRGAGVPHQQIAEKLGIGEKTCRRVVERRLAELRQTISIDARQIAAQHLLELEQVRARLRGPLAATDYQQRIAAARCWLQLLEREARLLGLDAPAKIELAAQSAAAEALLQHLADHLPTATMQEVIDALTT
jgi:DNA-binding Lrp family transcriptional regulator